MEPTWVSRSRQRWEDGKGTTEIGRDYVLLLSYNPKAMIGVVEKNLVVYNSQSDILGCKSQF